MTQLSTPEKCMIAVVLVMIGFVIGGTFASRAKPDPLRDKLFYMCGYLDANHTNAKECVGYRVDLP